MAGSRRPHALAPGPQQRSGCCHHPDLLGALSCLLRCRAAVPSPPPPSPSCPASPPCPPYPGRRCRRRGRPAARRSRRDHRERARAGHPGHRGPGAPLHERRRHAVGCDRVRRRPLPAALRRRPLRHPGRGGGRVGRGHARSGAVQRDRPRRAGVRRRAQRLAAADRRGRPATCPRPATLEVEDELESIDAAAVTVDKGNLDAAFDQFVGGTAPGRGLGREGVAGRQGRALGRRPGPRDRRRADRGPAGLGPRVRRHRHPGRRARHRVRRRAPGPRRPGGRGAGLHRPGHRRLRWSRHARGLDDRGRRHRRRVAHRHGAGRRPADREGPRLGRRPDSRGSSAAWSGRSPRAPTSST